VPPRPTDEWQLSVSKVDCSKFPKWAAANRMRFISAEEANFVAVMRDALQSTLANCRFLQPTLTGIAEDSGRVSRHIPMATAAADFGK
jgi:hypothetical protein